MSVEDDYLFYEREEAIEKFLNDSLKEISEDNVRVYLGTYGDAIQSRVKSCIKQAKDLYEKAFYGSSVTSASTAIELIMRFMLIRPLVQGAFLSDEWAQILSSRIGIGRSAEDRAILPSILKQWEIDISAFSLSDGKQLWETIKQQIIPKRNNIVHAGEQANQLDAELSIECAEILLNKVVKLVATKLNFTLDTTGRWSEVKREVKIFGQTEHGSLSRSFQPKSPFEKA